MVWLRLPSLGGGQVIELCLVQWYNVYNQIADQGDARAKDKNHIPFCYVKHAASLPRAAFFVGSYPQVKLRLKRIFSDVEDFMRFPSG